MELNNLKTEAAKLRLTSEEKTAMKARIFGAPLSVGAAQPSSYFTYSFQFLHARVLVPAMAVVLVFGGASTTAAAQGALPGDLLYPVKISINEAIKVALATTPIVKAEVSAELAVRRVEEAEVLAARGELTVAVGEELAAHFEAYAEDANNLANEVEAQDPDEAMSLRAKLGSSLQAHGAILATLTEGGAKDNQEGTGVVAARVLARTSGSSGLAYAPTTMMRSAKVAEPEATSMMLTVATDSATSAADIKAAGTISLGGEMMERVNEGGEVDAKRAQARAIEAFKSLREQFDDTKDKYAASAVTQVSGRLADIENLMELGSTTFDTGHYAEAENDYTDALESITKLSVLLRVQARLPQNIITPILEQNMEIESSLEIPEL